MLAALLAAIVFPLALPNELFPLGNPFIGLIALVPLYQAYRTVQSNGQAALVGVIFGGVSTFLANYWLMFFGEYSIWTIGGTTLGYIMYNAILGPFLYRALQARSGYRPLLFALVWTGYEYLKSVGFLGYPWGLAAYPFSTVTILVQFVDLTGVWGLTFLVVYLNAVIAETVSNLGDRTRLVMAGRNAVIVAVLAAAALTYGGVALARELPSRGTLRVLLVQQNADSWNTRDVAGPLRTAQELTAAGLEEMPNPDVIVWSETSLRYLYNTQYGRRWYEDHPAEQPFAEFLSQLPAPLLTGSPFEGMGGEFTIYNAALLLDGEGNVIEWYGKRQLVPFAEHVPLWENPAVQRFFQEVVGIQAIWAPGPEIRTFEVARQNGDPVTFGVPICFEDAFGYVGREFMRAGADLLINLTNNAWSRTDSAQLQHLVAARFRSVENRTTLVRGTNAGYTGVIDPWGRISDGLPMFEAAYLPVEVPVYDTPATLYVRWGDYLPLAILGGLLVLLVWSHVARARRGRGEGALPTNS
jgi:apolipoprotein N-acyltransferase